MKMTRDAVVTTKSQRNQNGRRSNYQGRRQRVEQGDLPVVPCGGPVTDEITRGNSQESPLPQLRQSPFKKSPHQISPQFHQNFENRSPTGSANSTVVNRQRGGRRATGLSPTNFFPQSYFPAAAAVSNVQRQRNSGPMPSPYFAGAKFGDAPSPAILPPPPSHWLSDGSDKTESCRMNARSSGLLTKEDHCIGLTSGLKVLLHVQ
jgi:hypothetical protein